METIGDCYMAVTGVPDPQPDHAVIMVQVEFLIVVHVILFVCGNPHINFVVCQSLPKNV